ncbi:MAG: hypothetical protein ABI200_05550 [Gaiellales bacterium]
MSRRTLLSIAGLLAVAVLIGGVAGSWGKDGAAPTPRASTAAKVAGGGAAGVSEPSKEARETRAELRRLQRAWADGGGTFGYPFWEKAGQRWRAGQITTPMYREYVTGYRDRLKVGCELLEQVEVRSDVARDVRSLTRSACETRLDALRDQQRWLREQIRRDALPELLANSPVVDSEDDGMAAEIEAERVDREKLDLTIAELDLQVELALQQSYRHTREAMDVMQVALDVAGLERLDEDAFI